MAYDGIDENAIERRASFREEHLKTVEKMSLEKKHLYAAAILDDHGNMIGSLLVVDFPTREALDDYLRVEPYVTGKVWEKIEIISCKVGPMFLR
jgi:uncharacterized protein YciI